MILKVLLVLSVIAIVYFMFIKKKPSVTSQKKAATKETPKANDMVACENCDIYVEINEAILSDAKYYCSNECLNAKV